MNKLLMHNKAYYIHLYRLPRNKPDKLAVHLISALRNHKRPLASLCLYRLLMQNNIEIHQIFINFLIKPRAFFRRIN